MRIDPGTALVRYLAQGPTRSLSRLYRELVAEGIEVSDSTIKKWSTRNEWQVHVRAFEARQREIEEQRLEALAHGWDQTEAMNNRHAELGAELQRLASAWAKKLAEDGHPMSPRDVARWAEAGVRIERLAVGAATSRHEHSWNEFILPVLALFQQVVVPRVPEDNRQTILTDFADGVNQIGRDATGLESGNDNH